MSVSYRGTSSLQSYFVCGFKLGMGSVDTVCDMSNRHVSHGHPMDVVESLYVRMGGIELVE